MKTENNSSVKFTAHESLPDLLVAHRIFPDGRKKPIGRVYRHFSEAGIIYTGISREGEQIISSENWSEVKDAFIRYAHKQTKLSRREKIESVYLEAVREYEIQNVRRRKKEIARSMTITK